MTTPEAARRDLHNGLTDLLGPERAETLMTFLPSRQPDDWATRSDLDDLRCDFRDLRTELKAEMVDLRTETNAGLTALNLRMDRLFVALVGGMLTAVAAMVGILLTVA